MEKITDDERFRRIAHRAIGRAAYFGSFRECVERGLYDRERILEELERCEMKENLELFARGADEAAAQIHMEIQAHFRERHPL